MAIPGEGQISLSNYRWLAPQTVTLPGGLNLNANYDDLLRLETYEMKDAAGQLIASGDYQYDKVNNIDQIVTEADIKDYGYDDLYRLTNATFTEGAATTNLESYGYDGVGNRLTAANDPVWLYNGKNQLISHENTTYEYDLNGNRSKKTILLPDTSTDETNYIYNPEERLVRVEDGSGSAIGEYYYDPFGLRLKKVAGGATTYFLYNGEGLAAEYDATGALIAEYQYGPNKPWMTDPLLQKRDGVYYYYQTDHLGTPQKLLAKNGNVVWQGEYSSFGEVTESVNTVTSLLRFPGQYEDGETGTFYNYFRDYDSSAARYVQTDPIGVSGGLNRYVYALQSPISRIDELGLSPALLIGPVFDYAHGRSCEWLSEQMDLYDRSAEARSERTIKELVRRFNIQRFDICTRKPICEQQSCFDQASQDLQTESIQTIKKKFEEIDQNPLRKQWEAVCNALPFEVPRKPWKKKGENS